MSAFTFYVLALLALLAVSTAFSVAPTAVARVGVLNRIQEGQHKKLAVVYALEKKNGVETQDRKITLQEREPVKAPLRF